EDGREALAKAIHSHPDVIVTETRLPGLNGLELCSLLRVDVATRDIPIVFVTGDAYEDQVKAAQDAGADTVLIKPCLPGTLILEIDRLRHLSADLRERGRVTRNKAMEQLKRSRGLLEQSHGIARRLTMSRAHTRHDTTTPPATPPALVCPLCDQP